MIVVVADLRFTRAFPVLNDGSELGRMYQQAVNWMPGIGDLPLYEELADQTAQDYLEVEQAMAGENHGMVRIDRDGHLMLTMAVPVQRYRKVLGVLLLSKDGAEIDAAVDLKQAGAYFPASRPTVWLSAISRMLV